MHSVCFLQGLELVSICRGLPGDILSRQPVKQAITAYSTLTRGDVGRFFKLHRKANWRQKRLMQVKLLQAGPVSKNGTRQNLCGHMASPLCNHAAWKFNMHHKKCSAAYMLTNCARHSAHLFVYGFIHTVVLIQMTS